MLPHQYAFLSAALFHRCRMLEIGTYDGVTAAMLAAQFPGAEITSIDLLRCENWMLNRRKNQRLWIGTAQQFAASAKPAQFDVILVDADHRYEGCRDDLFTARRLLTEHGRLFAHDYSDAPDWKWPGVTRAVKEYCAATGAKIVGRAGSLVEIGGAP